MTSAVKIEIMGAQGIHLDLASLEAPMREALRRAAIFLGYAVRSTEGQPVESIRLKSIIELDVGVPDPIPTAEQVCYQQEFRDWSIGQGLTELDQCYQRFVVSAMETKADLEELIEHRKLKDRHKPNLANTWSVHQQFYSSVGQTSARHEEEASCLRSLGNARNCLAHESGLVSSLRLREGGTMSVRWRGRDIFQTFGNGDRRRLPRDQEFCVQTDDVGTSLTVEEVIREHIYRDKDRIVFSAIDLSEIIFFYQNLAMHVGAEMHRFAEATPLFAGWRVRSAF